MGKWGHALGMGWKGASDAERSSRQARPGGEQGRASSRFGGHWEASASSSPAGRAAQQITLLSRRTVI